MAGNKEHKVDGKRLAGDKTNAFILLRAGILKQAMADWRKGTPSDRYALERWFFSEWGEALSNNHGAAIIEKLKKEDEEWKKNYEKRYKHEE